MGSEKTAGARSQTVVCLGVEPTGDAYSRGVGAFDLERFIFENQDSDDGVPTTHAPRPSLPPPTQLGGLPQPRAPRPQPPPQLGSALIGSAPRHSKAASAEDGEYADGKVLVLRSRISRRFLKRDCAQERWPLEEVVSHLFQPASAPIRESPDEPGERTQLYEGHR
mmetsp:Transcript_20739/g.48673  ORF Transcript_20739/g.48673 Transcript_20739/m.48673 type:complete len:166 (-) Transcript_20739:529-1026(-)